MNLLLLDENDLIDSQTAKITGDRFQHFIQILKASIGETFRVGIINGEMGTGEILSIDSHSLVIRFSLNEQPPKPLPLCVILALPRPKMLRRILKNSAELGIKKMYLIHSAKVEKSYWQTPFLAPPKIQDYFLEGLSQSRDTLMPELHIKQRFKPFVEDDLPAIIRDKEAFVAHPYEAKPTPNPCSKPRAIIIGPEGGFNDFEIALLKEQNVTAISMGQRIYRVENALTLLSTQLSYTA